MKSSDQFIFYDDGQDILINGIEKYLLLILVIEFQHVLHMFCVLYFSDALFFAATPHC